MLMLLLTLYLHFSMASPHTAGCVALILAALKLKSIPYSPYSVRRSIQNTAQNLDIDVFAQGHGLIQVRAWKAVGEREKRERERILFYDVIFIFFSSER